MAKYAMSKWFANGAGHMIRHRNSDTILFTWNGRPDGVAYFEERGGRVFVRSGVEYPNITQLIRAVEAEHMMEKVYADL